MELRFFCAIERSFQDRFFVVFILPGLAALNLGCKNGPFRTEIDLMIQSNASIKAGFAPAFRA